MVEGEYEWWEARVNPALAFRMMYPESCISFLCDTGRGHFDCGDRTALYLAKFIQKAIEQRLNSDGTLRKLNPKDGWLAERFHSASRPLPSPYYIYKGDKHDAFWYFDQEMAELTEARYQETVGKKVQYVGFEYEGKLLPYDEKLQGGMKLDLQDMEGITLHIKAVYTDNQP